MEINELFLNNLGFTSDKYWLKTTIGNLNTDITSYFSLIPNEIRFDIYQYKLFKTIDFCMIYDGDSASVIHSNNININNVNRFTFTSYNNMYSLL